MHNSADCREDGVGVDGGVGGGVAERFGVGVLHHSHFLMKGAHFVLYVFQYNILHIYRVHNSADCREDGVGLGVGVGVGVLDHSHFLTKCCSL